MSTSPHHFIISDRKHIVLDGSVITVQIDDYAVTLDASGQNPELGGCLAKLARAQDHMNTLDTELREFFDSDPYRALGEVEGKEGWYVFRVKTRREPPPRLGVLLGEYVHQVRSAFDHLAWALAKLHSGKGTPPSTIGFPLETNPKDFQWKAQHRLRGHIAPGWLAIIEAIQPDNANDDALGVLESLWNRDKHQVVIPVTQVTEAMTVSGAQFRPESDAITITEREPRAGVRLKDDAQIARVKIETTVPDPRVDMYVFAPLKVGGEEGALDLFWKLSWAESILSALLTLFPGGQDQPRFTYGSMMAGQVYHTAISTLDTDAEAEECGLWVPTRERRALQATPLAMKMDYATRPPPRPAP